MRVVPIILSAILITITFSNLRLRQDIRQYYSDKVLEEKNYRGALLDECYTVLETTFTKLAEADTKRKELQSINNATVVEVERLRVALSHLEREADEVKRLERELREKQNRNKVLQATLEMTKKIKIE
ncbi:hypothetical protein Pcinc_015748 [Petrolisthes cinctipes]|uniref:Uncharacterized protein n=1 Tax=Petrolisthes cinctipes TaxID=88211 RepID=A0AAE1KRU7_PETCI|nr:hypothetical protein Pcinc_015748 [Petrolisthes cinctipes]